MNSALGYSPNVKIGEVTTKSSKLSISVVKLPLGINVYL